MISLRNKNDELTEANRKLNNELSKEIKMRKLLENIQNLPKEPQTLMEFIHFCLGRS